MDQDTLFELPPTYHPGRPRPREDDEAVVKAAARSLAEALIKQHPDDFEAAAVDSYAEDLAELLDDGTTDGYELAKALEDKGWSIDAELVETLNGAAGEIDDAHDEAIRAWVQGVNLQPVFAVGDPVVVDGHHIHVPVLGRTRYFPTLEVIVRSVDAGRAQYTVYAQSLGYLTDEQMAENAAAKSMRDRFHSGSTGFIVDYERVRRPYCYGCGWPNPGGVCLSPEVV